MMASLLFVSVFAVLTMLISPRLFLHADRFAARAHVQRRRDELITAVAPRDRAPLRQARVKEPVNSLTEHSHLLDSLARAVRSHSPTRHALIEMLAMMRSTSATSDLREWLLQGKDIHEGLQRCEPDTSESRLFLLLQHSLVHGVFIASALEQSAALLREDARHQSDVITASAQARSSARILTLLPFAILLLLFLTSSSTRREISTLPVLVVLTFGIAFNRLGWLWVQQLVKRSALSRTSIASKLSEKVVVSLRAGVSLRQSIENWALKNDPVLFQGLSTGQSMQYALQDFSQRHDSDAQLLGQILIDAERDGLPVMDTIHRLSSEMRSRRQHASDVRMRQLPTKLAMPIVFCILPSFIFLTVIPLVISNLHHFQFSPPPTSITS
jgi:Flp pilus assembly protein TadB